MDQTQADHNVIYQRILQLCQQAGATFWPSRINDPITRINDPINGAYPSDSNEVEIVFDNGLTALTRSPFSSSRARTSYYHFWKQNSI